MFAKLSVVAALALAPWAQALLLQIPVNWHSSSNVNVSWSHTATDPTFTLQLFSTDAFHDTFSIANNLDPTADFAAFQLGVVPQGQYTLRAINITNVGQVYDETPSFTVQAPLTDSTTTTSSTSSVSSSSSGHSSAGGTTTVRPTAGSTSGFGVTVSASSTTPATLNSASPTTSGSSDGSSTNFNSATSLYSFAPLALAALGVVAGVAVAL